MKKTHRIIAILILIPLLLASCIDVSSLVPSTETEAPPVSTEAVSTEFPLAVISPAQPNQTFGVGYVPGKVIDPFKTDSDINMQLGYLLYDRLFNVGPDGTVVPGICEKITTKDNIHYELTILSGLTFHNGDPLTVRDVAYSLRRALSSSLYRVQLSCVSSVSSDTSENTISITLSSPLASLSALLDFPIVASDTSASYSYSNFALLGSGRYYIDLETLEGTEYTFLQSNSNWYGYGGRRPALPRIDLFSVTDKEDLLRRYFNSDIDVLSISSVSNDPIALHGEAEKREITGGNLFFLGFNTRQDAFASVNGRRGIASFFDSESLCEAVDASKLLPTKYPVRAESRVASYLSRVAVAEEEAVNPYSYLRAAGFSDSSTHIRYLGGEYTLKLLTCSDSDMMVSIANAVADVLEKGTFIVEIASLPYKEYIQALYNGSFSLYIGMTQPAENYDYSYLIQNADLFSSLMEQVTGQDAAPRGAGVSEDVIACLDAIRLLDNNDPLYFLDLSGAIAKLFDDYVPFVPLCFDKDTVYLRGSFVSNVSVTNRNVFYNIDSWTLPK